VPFIIGDPCIDVTDMSCVEECPVDCIYEGKRKLYIQPVECIDCGACEAVCPVEAIVPHRSVAPEQAEHVADNARFFAEVLPGHDAPLGAPGGSRKAGPIGTDTPLVEAAASSGRAL
jgi:NAD-dependent dihydropyrimidine dehydrogenase PreA subunit